MNFSKLSKSLAASKKLARLSGECLCKKGETCRNPWLPLRAVSGDLGSLHTVNVSYDLRILQIIKCYHAMMPTKFAMVPE